MKKFKLCPNCELNYILNDGDELCEVCRPKTLKSKVKTNNTLQNFSELKANMYYGTNTKDIYEKCCEVFGWDEALANRFGWQKPCYAEYADGNANVWFITNSNLNNFKGSSEKWSNEIVREGDEIIEHWDKSTPSNTQADKNFRITFAKNNSGYMFLGIYERVSQDNCKRLFTRISKVYEG